VVDISMPDFTLEEITAVAGYAKSYQLLKDNVATGDTINIPSGVHVTAA